MRLSRSILFLGAIAACVGPATADTLRDALVKAYESNPTLTASRAQQRATDENVPIARSAGRPTFGVSGTADENFARGGNSFTTPERVARSSATVSLPIFTGGRVKNSVLAAETRVDAGQANLRGTEASLFTEVVAAYNNVIRDEAIVGLNTQNVRVLETNLDASRDRFQVGDLTRTDVAQSQARLSLARAQLQSAQATLIGSRENYIRLVGSPPGTLDQPPPLPNLPTSPEAAVEVAIRNNPSLLAAQRLRVATDYDVRVARAGRLPQVGVNVGANYVNYLGSLGAGTGLGVGQSGTSTSTGLSLQLPILQGGLVSARVRQAQALRGQAIEQVTATERQIVSTTRSAYASWRSSQEVIQSANAAVEANKLSLEGVRAENSVGNRTILDILNAEQELLNSQVTLVTARRDAYVAAFALLAAMGEAEARDLNLDGGPLYNPVTNYESVRRRSGDFGGSVTDVPVAPSTAATKPQTAVVTRPLEGALKDEVDRKPALTTGANSPNR